MSDRHVVLLDLDGTLIDSAPGILAGIHEAFRAVDVVPPADAVMRAWIGPPVRETLARELGVHGDAAVERANAAFRESSTPWARMSRWPLRAFTMRWLKYPGGVP